MYKKINDTDLKTLTLFTKGYNKEYYIRELNKLLKVSPRTSFVTLKKMEKFGILKSKLRGKIKTYSIVNSHISREFFILTEQYKKIQFLEKNHLIKEVLEKIDQHIQGIVIVFGSFAKDTQKEDSDLDLFIVGKYNEKEINKVSRIYNLEIDIKTYPKRTFKKYITEDILLKEIIENHIIIKGTENFVNTIAKWIR